VRRLAAVGLLVVAAVLPLAASAGVADRSVSFLLARQQADGGFAEPGRQSTPGLSAWAVLALVAAGHQPSDSALAYLRAQSGGSSSDLELRALALLAAREDTDAAPLLDQVAKLAAADGTIGGYVSSTAWGVLALRAGGRPAPPASVQRLLDAQAASGGWSWSGRGAPDADDTAAVIEALRAAGEPPSAPAIRRGLAFLRRCQARNGGFQASPGAGANAQTSAWAIQAFAAAGRNPGKRALAYLGGLRRVNGSYRYNAKLAVSPVWVTSEVVPAVLGKAFPLHE
jgi:iron complex transport system substrate-binding protein